MCSDGAHGYNKYKSNNHRTTKTVTTITLSKCNSRTNDVNFQLVDLFTDHQENISYTKSCKPSQAYFHSKKNLTSATAGKPSTINLVAHGPHFAPISNVFQDHVSLGRTCKSDENVFMCIGLIQWLNSRHHPAGSVQMAKGNRADTVATLLHFYMPFAFSMRGEKL